MSARSGAGTEPGHAGTTSLERSLRAVSFRYFGSPCPPRNGPRTDGGPHPAPAFRLAPEVGAFERGAHDPDPSPPCHRSAAKETYLRREARRTCTDDAPPSPRGDWSTSFLETRQPPRAPEAPRPTRSPCSGRRR